MEEILTMNAVQKYLSEIGTKGGSAGRGASKRRGDSDYYKRIRAAREEKRKKKKPDSSV
jgi:hypothetical protein